LQLDKEVKMKKRIYDDVAEILRRRGFFVWVYRINSYRANIKHGEQWWLLSEDTCNWIKK